MIRIIAVGKSHDRDLADAINGLQKRLQRPFDVEWVLLPYSPRQGDTARQDESQAILAKLRTDEYVVVLDERGQQMTSPALSQLLTDQFAHGKSVVIVIGGAYGVDEQLRARADIVWSLSQLVFPHQLVRLILIEQLYRSQAIASGHPYHHE